jgi:pectin methylesterase-like acyl-CoA thioesterase
MILPRQQVLEVCKSGCQYTTIIAALAAITDAAANKRYVIKVGPGTYMEGTLNPKSYVSIIGSGRNVTFLDETQVLSNPGAAITEVVLESMTIDNSTQGCVRWEHDDTAAPTTLYMYDVQLGMQDGSNSAADNCLMDMSNGGHIIYFINSKCQTNLEAFALSAKDTWIDVGSEVEITQTQFDAGSEFTDVWSDGRQGGGMLAKSFTNGATIISRGMRVYSTTLANVGPPPMVAILVLQGATGTTYGGLYVSINDMVIDLTDTETGSWPISIVDLGVIGTNANASLIQLNNVSANITSTAGTHPINGINVSTVDADQANYTIQINGGAWKFTSAGGAVNDVVNSGTATVVINGLNHAGNYSGTTPPTFSNPIPKFAGAAPTASGQLIFDSTANDLEYGDNGTNRKVANLDEAQTFTNKTLTAPLLTLADLAVGTCAAGQIAIDSGGATKEWCVCATLNTWGCWKLTDGTFNANGPAD